MPLQNSIRVKNGRNYLKTKDPFSYLYHLLFTYQTNLMFNSFLLLIRISIKTKAQLLLEVIMLAKQLEIYQRSDPKLKITGADRIFFSIFS